MLNFKTVNKTNMTQSVKISHLLDKIRKLEDCEHCRRELVKMYDLCKKDRPFLVEWNGQCIFVHKVETNE